MSTTTENEKQMKNEESEQHLKNEKSEQLMKNEEQIKEETKEEEKVKEENKEKVEEEKQTNGPIRKQSSFLTSTITKKNDEPVVASEDLELKGLQEKFIESNLKDEVLFKSKCLLYIFNKEKKKFEERGPGDIMINKEKETEMIKVVMIRESIMRFGCNHYINPRHKLIKNENINNGWVWCTTEDTVDDETNKKKFYLVKFDTSENTEKFKSEYEKGRLANKEILEK
ncbi:Ran-specific GTPase-activating protein 1 (DNLI1) [Vairimorpha necatrix]|uniref:Ran-specific GTPase-activating protein 1 (DNLI1) n=1 Tax=Vairimorpha necatrix TaxID=6039 RepID=A0AAX4JCM7_9MICR